MNQVILDTEEDELVNNMIEELDAEQAAIEAIRSLESEKRPLTPQELSAEFPEMFVFTMMVLKDLRSGKDVLVKAPVKSGKRIHTEITGALKLDKEVVIYHSSFWQNSMSGDMDSISSYGVDVHITNTKNKVDELIEKIKKALAEGKVVYLHFDESDHGTAKKGLYADFRASLDSILTKEEKNNVRHVYISATPQEILASIPFKQGKIALHQFTPPDTYFGAEKFLLNNLVHDCPDLLKYCPSQREWIPTKEFLTILVKFFHAPEDKNISVIRGAKKYGRKRKEFGHSMIKKSRVIRKIIQNLAKKMGVELEIEFVDCEETTGYSWENKAQTVANSKMKHIVFINQMAKRSVNLQCHRNLHTFLEDRTEKSNFATKSQSIFRVVHYVNNIGDNFGIQVYGDKKIFELEAGLISEDEYLDKGQKLSARVRAKRNVVSINNSNESVFGTMKEMTANVKHKFINQPKMFQVNGELTRHSMANNSVRDIAREILDGVSLPLPVFVDGPNPNFLNSYVELSNKRPDLMGKYYYKSSGSGAVDTKTYNSVYDERYIANA